MTTAPRMQPLSGWSAVVQQPVAGVLTDIDDTLTRDGAIEPEALDALHRLQAAGVPVIAVTGRPAGWSEPFARAWPVLAIVAENGSLRVSGRGGGLDKCHVQSAAVREANFQRLQAVLAAIELEVPGARRAQDSAGRETDIAIDHSEFAHLDPALIEQVVQRMRAGGLTATVSSIHINGWIGDHNKWTGALWAVQGLLGRDLGVGGKLLQLRVGRNRGQFVEPGGRRSQVRATGLVQGLGIGAGNGGEFSHVSYSSVFRRPRRSACTLALTSLRRICSAPLTASAAT